MAGVIGVGVIDVGVISRLSPPRTLAPASHPPRTRRPDATQLLQHPFLTLAQLAEAADSKLFDRTGPSR